MEKTLFQYPWTLYTKTFFHSRITLLYPENLMFTTQLIQQLLASKVYQDYPFAEKIHWAAFRSISWEKAIIVIDSDLHLLLAPDAVHHLVRLYRRLHYAEAHAAIFHPFEWVPFRFFAFQEGVLLIMVMLGTLFWLIRAWNTSKQILVLSSKVRGVSKTSRS